MRTVLTIALAAALGAGTLAAQAGQGGGHGGGHGFGHGGRLLERLDLDGDGAISRDEARAFGDGRFQRWDRDSDGAVTEAEMIEAAQERVVRRVAKMFARLDANDDGRIERVELEAMGLARFDRMDADGDGRVSFEEAGWHRDGGAAKGGTDAGN